MPIFRNNLVLYNGSEFEDNASAPADLDERDLETYRSIVQWTRNYLCQPHDMLGREGPVCPFTQPSLSKHLFWLTIMRGGEIDLQAATDAVLEYKDWFFELEPVSGSETILKTILIIFPELPHDKAKEQLEGLHKLLKPDFVRKAIMVGQFYEGCPESGLWNEHFHPLQSPLPLLAIRNMVPSDFPFLHGKRGNSDMLIAYLNRFGTNIPPEVKRLMVQALEESSLGLRPRVVK
jgi:hypothetical protein